MKTYINPRKTSDHKQNLRREKKSTATNWVKSLPSKQMIVYFTELQSSRTYSYIECCILKPEIVQVNLVRLRFKRRNKS